MAERGKWSSPCSSSQGTWRPKCWQLAVEVLKGTNPKDKHYKREIVFGLKYTNILRVLAFLKTFCLRFSKTVCVLVNSKFLSSLYPHKSIINI